MEGPIKAADRAFGGVTGAKNLAVSGCLIPKELSAKFLEYVKSRENTLSCAGGRERSLTSSPLDRWPGQRFS